MGYSIFDETIVDMTWPEVEKAAQAGAIALLPNAVIEEHGPHMSFGTDVYGSCIVCRIAKRELAARGITALIAPPFYWGMNDVTAAFPGSFTVRKETMKAVVHDILVSLNRWGITYVFNVNSHGDDAHIETTMEAFKEARMSSGVRAFYVVRESDLRRFHLTGREGHVLVQTSPQGGPPPKFFDVHAGAGETGMIARYFPNTVNTDVARTLKPTDLEFDAMMAWTRGWSTARKITPLGYFGNPAGFDPAAAEKSVEANAKGLAEVIDNFMKGKYRPLEGPVKA